MPSRYPLVMSNSLVDLSIATLIYQRLPQVFALTQRPCGNRKLVPQCSNAQEPGFEPSILGQRVVPRLFCSPHYVENLEQLAVFGQMVCAFHSGTGCLLLDCSCLLATRSLLPGCEPG